MPMKGPRLGLRGKPRVWVYMVDGRNSGDIAELDSKGFDLWRANPRTKAGDIILMYRTRPYSDIAWVFRALSDARPSPRRGRPRDWWEYEVEIGEGYRLQRVIPLADLRNEPALRRWSFLKYQQGVMNRRRDITEAGYWRVLRRILLRRGVSLRDHLRGLDSVRPTKRAGVFLCYATEDRKKVRKLYNRLRRAGVQPWLDVTNVDAGQKWDKEIERALKRSRAVVLCLTPKFVSKIGYLNKEMGMTLILSISRRDFVYPVKLEQCRVPGFINAVWQVSSLSRRGEFRRLVNRLRSLPKSKDAS